MLFIVYINISTALLQCFLKKACYCEKLHRLSLVKNASLKDIKKLPEKHHKKTLYKILLKLQLTNCRSQICQKC